MSIVGWKSIFGLTVTDMGGEIEMNQRVDEFKRANLVLSKMIEAILLKDSANLHSVLDGFNLSRTISFVHLFGPCVLSRPF